MGLSISYLWAFPLLDLLFLPSAVQTSLTLVNVLSQIVSKSLWTDASAVSDVRGLSDFSDPLPDTMIITAHSNVETKDPLPDPAEDPLPDPAEDPLPDEDPLPAEDPLPDPAINTAHSDAGLSQVNLLLPSLFFFRFFSQ